MVKIMFDSNVFDLLTPILEKLSKQTKYQYYITVTQIEELCSTPDSNKEKRIQLLLAFAQLRPIMVPTSVAIWGIARWDLSRLGEGKVYSDILNENKSNTNDAIIADTSVTEGCTLITNDKRLYNKMILHNYSAMLFEEFVKGLD